MSITPLPEPEHDDHVDVRFKRHTCYTEAQLRAYGAAEYKRGIGDAAQTCTAIATSPSNCVLGVAVECATAIRKLGAAAS